MSMNFNTERKKLSRVEWKELCRHKIVILDGATGTMLHKRGMPKGACPEKWILDNPSVLEELQTEYLMAGTDIIYTPTFTANRIKLKEYGLDSELVRINRDLVGISLKARDEYNKKSDRQVYIAGDISMTGEQLSPMGTLDFEELIDIYKEQMDSIKDLVDLFAIETMMSLQECRAALIAAKEVCPEVPVMVTLTFNEDGRTLYGTEPATAMLVLESMGADAVGLNCSTGPEGMLSLIKKMREVAYIPIIAKPNAGMPKLVDGQTVYGMEAEEFAEETLRLIKEGAGIVGGCCGSTPEHIMRLAVFAREMAPPYSTMVEDSLCSTAIESRDASEIQENSRSNSTTVENTKHIRALTTERETTLINLSGSFMVIGERINPTGKKLLQEKLKNKDMELVGEFAREQEEKGADILDVNMGMGGVDEKELMLLAIDEVMGQSSLPISIDSSNVDVIEAALRRYPGRALINSISLETEKFEKLIPIAKKYGAMFILLPLSDAGLPKNIDEKKEIIGKILDRAFSFGLTKEDIIVDALVNTVGANKNGALEALETISYCKEMGLATVCGLSNISFGLPERALVNSAFLSFAIREGLTMAIANPSQSLLMGTARAADLLLNKEDADLAYIEQVERQPLVLGNADASAKGGMSKNESGKKSEKESPEDEIFQLVVRGNRKKIVTLVRERVKSGTEPSEILNELLIPAINHVGELFDKQIYFLPQLINSAEAMKLAVEYLEPLLKKEDNTETPGTIVMATVEGDIHDIGKNLVVLMLKNYGYRVIDLGKDVKCGEIIECARREKADIIGLSALMTTTMTAMRDVIEARNRELPDVKVIVGGAVVTKSYADEIGADGYSGDAGDAVRLVRELLR